MLLEVLGTANGASVLGAIHRHGGRARFTDIRNAASIGDAQVTRAIKALNKRGLVAAKPGPDGKMSYVLTKLGQEVMLLIEDLHKVVHRHRSKGIAAQTTDAELERILVS